MADHQVSPCCAASRADGPRADAPTASNKKAASRAGEAPDARAEAGSTEGMVHLEGGTFLMGTEDAEGFPADGEGPVREVVLDPFYIDEGPVTNDLFAAFVEATGYETEAERFGWSFVFHSFLHPKVAKRARQGAAGALWWRGVNDACWRWPEGRGSHIADRMDHPVVHVTWNDAVVYAEWAGKRLPTEAEWEYAARGGLEQARFAWGDELTPDGEHLCNIWQGTFPDVNTEEDGFTGTSPVGAFPANGYGLYDVAGNVWEWCADWFSADHHAEAPRENPHGPPTGTTRVMRGGSYLCHASYCNRYRVAARSRNTPDSSTGNLGFRCVRDAG